MKQILLFMFALFLCPRVNAAAEETIRGVLEKTTRAGACAQITDVLGETYYVLKTDESEKLVADFVGKNIRVVITGTAEQKEGDASWYFNLKSVKKYEAKTEGKPATESKKE
ncbi:MAG TPA: hypothetical protein VEJ63_03840 [Planctomycetota bacterium]|nr:hypothetical protein [Planctomycetota bacterium]